MTFESGVLDTSQPGDCLMADRGFDIVFERATHHISLDIPPFQYGHDQLSANEVVQTKWIASMQILVKRTVQTD